MYGLHAREMNLLRGGAVFVQKDMHVCGCCIVACCVLHVACCMWGRTCAKANLIRRVGHGFGSARILGFYPENLSRSVLVLVIRTVEVYREFTYIRWTCPLSLFVVVKWHVDTDICMYVSDLAARATWSVITHMTNLSVRNRGHPPQPGGPGGDQGGEEECGELLYGHRGMTKGSPRSAVLVSFSKISAAKPWTRN